MSHDRKSKQAPEDLYYIDLFLYVCLFLVFLSFAKEFKFYTVISSFPPEGTFSNPVMTIYGTDYSPFLKILSVTFQIGP